MLPSKDAMQNAVSPFGDSCKNCLKQHVILAGQSQKTLLGVKCRSVGTVGIFRFSVFTKLTHLPTYQVDR